MRLVRVFAPVMGAVLAAGCSIHPLPEDVTRKSTYDIVHKFRCEAKQAVLDYAPETMFDPAVLGYEFNFKITENNGANVTNLEFKKLFTTPAFFDLQAVASAKKTRVGERDFKIVETFADLKKTPCTETEFGRNMLYPIAGSIGLGEVIQTYARIERETNLAPSQGSTLPVFSDKLTFTTMISAGLTPLLTLAPVHHFKLVTATGIFSSDRQDIHFVNIAIARDNRNDPRRLTRAAVVAQRFTYVHPLAPGAIQDQVSARDRVLFELDRQRLLDLGVLPVGP